MSLEQVTLIVFFALLLGCIAVTMAIRDLVWGVKPHEVLRPRTLRRVPNVHDEEPANTLTGKLDQGFARLVVESGVDTSILTAFLMLIASGLLCGGVVYLSQDHAMLGLLAGAVGMLFPLAVMLVMRGRRMSEVEEGMPHMVDLLARAVRAGESVDQALALIGSESKGVIGREFTRCARQLDMGMGLDSVMRSLTRRIRLPELRMLSTTLMVHRQTGGNLPQALDRMVSVMRDRRNAIRQMRASTGAGRSSTLLIAVVSPIAYLVCFLYFPDHVKPLLDDVIGRALLLIAVCLEMIGILWVLNLVKNPT